MKAKHYIAIVGVVALTAIVSLNRPSHTGPSFLYPDSSLTPGLVATTNIDDLTKSYGGQTYSQHFRNVTDATKKQVMQEYGNPPGQIEIDHFCPIALGCSNDIKNLWAQPEPNMWNGYDYGFRAKDQLEAYLVRQVKAKIITPQDVQNCILKDWVACYDKYIKGKVGSIEQPDNDDLINN